MEEIKKFDFQMNRQQRILTTFMIKAWLRMSLRPKKKQESWNYGHGGGGERAALSLFACLGTVPPYFISDGLAKCRIDIL